MELFDSFLNAAERCGYLDSAEKEGDTYTLIGNNKSLQVVDKVNRDGSREVLLWSKADPQNLRKVLGSGIETVLPRLVVQHFTGTGDAVFAGTNNTRVTYKDVGIFPCRIISGMVMFGDHAGRRWLCQSSNEPEITLRLYMDLADACADHSLVHLPFLFPRNKVKINSAVDISRAKEEATVVSSLADLKRHIPNYEEYLLFPKPGAIPFYGTAIVSGKVVSSSDREILTKSFQNVNIFIGSASSRPIQSAKIAQLRKFRAIASSARRPIKSAKIAQLRKFRAIASSAKRPIRSAKIAQLRKFRAIASSAFPKAIVSSAELFKLKLYDSGGFSLDLARKRGSHELYSSLKGECDLAPLIELSKKAGYTFQELCSGVDLSASSVLPEIKKFLVSGATFKPVEVPSTDRSVVRWVVSGKNLDAELRKWGLNNFGQIFNSMRVLGVNLDGKADFRGIITSSKIAQLRKFRAIASSAKRPIRSAKIAQLRKFRAIASSAKRPIRSAKIAQLRKFRAIASSAKRPIRSAKIAQLRKFRAIASSARR